MDWDLFCFDLWNVILLFFVIVDVLWANAPETKSCELLKVGALLSTYRLHGT